jgi:gas vesicle protein
VASCNVTTKVTYFLAGLGVGAVVALLFAPKSGEETRKFLADKAEGGKDYLAAKGRELQKHAEEFVDKGKEVVTKQKERLADVLEAGRQAARNTLAR